MSGSPLDTPITAKPPDAGVANLDDARAGAYGPGHSSLRRRSEAAPAGGRPHLTLASYEVSVASPHTQVSLDHALADKPPHIKVEVQDPTAAPPATQPAATIKNDGSVVDGKGKTVVDRDGNILDRTFLSSPSFNSDLTIRVANDSSAGLPNDAQKRVLNKLTDIWGQDVQTAFDGKLETIQTTDGTAVKHVSIDDPNHLVSDEVAQKFGNNIPADRIASTIPPQEVAPPAPAELPPEQQVSDATSRAVQHVNSDFPQGGSGERRASDTDQYYAQRTPNQDEGSYSDYLNMIAGVTRQDVASSRHVGDGIRFGLYGTGPRTFSDYVFSFLSPEILAQLGTPPDLSKLAELLKDNPKLLEEIQKSLKEKGAPEELIADFADPTKAQNFAAFAGKVVTGKGDISPAEMKAMMGESFQNKIALATVKKYKDAGASPSDIALAYQFDKDPKALSQQERDSDTGKAIASASSRLYLLSHARQGANPGDEIRWTGDNKDPNSVAFRLIQEAKRHQNGEAKGCVRAHDATVNAVFGIRPTGDAFNNLFSTYDELNRKYPGQFKMVHIDGRTNETSLQPGDQAGMPYSRQRAIEMGANYGHIWTQGFNGDQISQGTWNLDRTHWNNYDTSRIYAIRYVGSQSNRSSSDS